MADMITRTSIIRISLFCILLLTPSGAAQELPSVSPAEAGLSESRLQRLEQTMQQYVEDGKVPGIVTLLIRHGGAAHFESFGELDPELGTPMPRNAIFRIASQTKAITSAAVMILYEEGKLLLEDPVSSYIPQFADPTVAVEDEEGNYLEVPARREIRIRDLLTHTSGLSYGAGPAEAAYRFEDLHGWYFADHQEPIGAAIRRLAQLPLVSHPGEEFVYGFSTDVLGHLVEVVSGMSLAEFFQERILDPLKMVDTHFYLPEEKIDRFTPVYGLTSDGALELRETPEESEYVFGPRQCYSGGAGLLSTARDYGRFLLMLLNGGELEGVRILSPKSVELMTVNHVADLFGDRGFGLGFWVTRDLGASAELGTLNAFGWGGAYHTVYWVDPGERMVALLMCQLLPAGGSDLQEKFRALVYQSIVESGSQ